MGKLIDKFWITLFAAFILYLLCHRLTGSIPIALLSALLLLAILWMAKRNFHRKIPRDVLSKRDFVRFVLLRGNGVLKHAVELSIGERYQISDAEGHTLLSEGERAILIYYVYKFGSLSEEDVAKSYRLAEKCGADTIYALTNHIDRKAIAVTEYIPQKVTLISAGTLYKYLLKRRLIPEKSAFSPQKRQNGKLLKLMINERNAKYYIFAGLSTSLIAAITPFTTYYVVFSFINLSLAIACVIFSERSEGKDELFKS